MVLYHQDDSYSITTRKTMKDRASRLPSNSSGMLTLWKWPIMLVWTSPSWRVWWIYLPTRHLVIPNLKQSIQRRYPWPPTTPGRYTCRSAFCWDATSAYAGILQKTWVKLRHGAVKLYPNPYKNEKPPDQLAPDHSDHHQDTMWWPRFRPIICQWQGSYPDQQEWWMWRGHRKAAKRYISYIMLQLQQLRPLIQVLPWQGSGRRRGPCDCWYLHRWIHSEYWQGRGPTGRHGPQQLQGVLHRILLISTRRC